MVVARFGIAVLLGIAGGLPQTMKLSIALRQAGRQTVQASSGSRV